VWALWRGKDMFLSPLVVFVPHGTASAGAVRVLLTHFVRRVSVVIQCLNEYKPLLEIRLFIVLKIMLFLVFCSHVFSL